jgi:hypothetical protein
MKTATVHHHPRGKYHPFVPVRIHGSLLKKRTVSHSRKEEKLATFDNAVVAVVLLILILASLVIFPRVLDWIFGL